MALKQQPPPKIDAYDKKSLLLLALVAAVIYLGIFGIKLTAVSHTSSQHRLGYNACTDQYNKQYAKYMASVTYIKDPAVIKATDGRLGSITLHSGSPPAPCQQLGSIHYGVLGLPYYCCDAY